MNTARNKQCACGSGKKYKHCCLKKELERKASLLVEERNKANLSGEDRLQIFLWHPEPAKIEEAALLKQVDWMIERTKREGAKKSRLVAPLSNIIVAEKEERLA